jgi:hypothetical protein
MQLRKAGVNPFEEHAVDFFFTMPDVNSSVEVMTQLVDEGFGVSGDYANPDGSHSLNLQRRMRLIVPEMQALTARFKALAEQCGGKYDNWAVAGSRATNAGAIDSGVIDIRSHLAAIRTRGG